MLISEGMLKTVDGVLCALVVSTFDFFMPSMSAKAPMPMASRASAPAAIFMFESGLLRGDRHRRVLGHRGDCGCGACA